MDRVKKNLDMAASVYIERVNHSPCGQIVIHLLNGADSSSQIQRDHLLVHLKGSKKKKIDLKLKEPESFYYCYYKARTSDLHSLLIVSHVHVVTVCTLCSFNTCLLLSVSTTLCPFP